MIDEELISSMESCLPSAPGGWRLSREQCYQLIRLARLGLWAERCGVPKLEDISSHDGMTNFGRCCVNGTCSAAYDEDGEKVSSCQFGYGVNRGFNTCAAEAKSALASLPKVEK